MKVHQLLESKVQWAIGKHIDKGTNLHQHNTESEDFTTITVDIKKLFDNTIDMQRLSTKGTGGPNAKQFRIKNAKQFWEQGGHMDLAVISYDSYHKRIQFTDGRHRLVAAYQMGEKNAPVLAYTKNLDKLKALLK